MGFSGDGYGLLQMISSEDLVVDFPKNVLEMPKVWT